MDKTVIYTTIGMCALLFIFLSGVGIAIIYYVQHIPEKPFECNINDMDTYNCSTLMKCNTYCSYINNSMCSKKHFNLTEKVCWGR